MKEKLSLCIAALLLCAHNVCAQSFEDGYLNSAVSASETSAKRSNQASPKAIDTDSNIEDALAEEKKKLKEEYKENTVFLPGGGMNQLEHPTADKSVRGGSFVIEVNEKGDKIFLYYDNFRINSSFNNMVSCDVRFFVLANIDRKITNLDVKLVWPKMTTGVSFSDIAPNTPTYMNYSLIGDGCYTMDKIPNIIVNRCRIKGMSASECASKILWLNLSSRK